MNDEPAGRDARQDADRLSPAALTRAAARRTGARQAAFFDLDKTIIAKSSTLVMRRTFMRDGLLRSRSVIKNLYAPALYQLVGADHQRMEQMRLAILALTRGWDAARVRALTRQAMQEVIAPLVYPEALDLIAQHRRAGHDVWIMSSSGEEVVEPLAEHLGVTDVVATRSGIDHAGRYDGTLEFYAYGEAKAHAIRQLAQVRGYTLARCFAYSDSITDLPMLEAVGYPIASNPDRHLRGAATTSRWPILDFAAPVRTTNRLPAVAADRAGPLISLAGAALVALAVWCRRTRRPVRADVRCSPGGR